MILMGRVGMNRSTSSQVFGIDLLRFGAASFVCAFHLTYWGSVPGSTTNAAMRNAASFPEIDWLTRSGWVGVEVFFVISGFVIAYSASEKDAARFFRSRLLRLAPAAWSCATITLTVAVLAGILNVPSAQIAYIKSMTFFPYGPWIDGVYWTLGIEISFYALVWLLLACHGFRFFGRLIFLIGFISTTASIVSVIFPTDLYFSRKMELLLVRHGSSFALGSLLWLVFFDRFTLPRVVGVAILMASISLEISLTSGGNYGGATVPILIFLTCEIVMIASIRYNYLLSLRLSSFSKKLLRNLGLVTYPFYLLHNVVGAYLIRLFVGAGYGAWSSLAASVSTVILISFCVSLVVEPALRSAMGALFPHQAGSTA
jgi:peptidoglycan/LPS O-acetylase OafA/YrhL